MGKFKIGQRVRQWDDDINDYAYGVVTEVGNYAVMILWDDIADDCEHRIDEWDSIKIVAN
jgi:hypothetical protein